MIKPGQSVYLRVTALGRRLSVLHVTRDHHRRRRNAEGASASPTSASATLRSGDTGTEANLIANGITGADRRKLGTKAVVFDDSVDWMTLPRRR